MRRRCRPATLGATSAAASRAPRGLSGGRQGGPSAAAVPKPRPARPARPVHRHPRHAHAPARPARRVPGSPLAAPPARCHRGCVGGSPSVLPSGPSLEPGAGRPRRASHVTRPPSRSGADRAGGGGWGGPGGTRPASGCWTAPRTRLWRGPASSGPLTLRLGLALRLGSWAALAWPLDPKIWSLSGKPGPLATVPGREGDRGLREVGVALKGAAEGPGQCVEARRRKAAA